MDVLQKWNRSIPDGNGTAAAVLFFLLFIFLKQFYLFPSGGMEAADVCLFASFFMLLCDCVIRRPERLFKRKGQILRSTPNTAPLICGACNTQPEGLSTMA